MYAASYGARTVRGPGRRPPTPESRSSRPPSTWTSSSRPGCCAPAATGPAGPPGSAAGPRSTSRPTLTSASRAPSGRPRGDAHGRGPRPAAGRTRGPPCCEPPGSGPRSSRQPRAHAAVPAGSGPSDPPPSAKPSWSSTASSRTVGPRPDGGCSTAPPAAFARSPELMTAAARAAGSRVTVLEAAEPSPCGRVLVREVAQIFAGSHTDHGAELRCRGRRDHRFRRPGERRAASRVRHGLRRPRGFEHRSLVRGIAGGTRGDLSHVPVCT